MGPEQDADTVRAWVESLDNEALHLFMRWVMMLWMQRNQIPAADACPECSGRGQTVFLHGPPPPLGRGDRYVTCARCLGTGRKEAPDA